MSSSASVASHGGADVLARCRVLSNHALRNGAGELWGGVRQSLADYRCFVYFRDLDGDHHRGGFTPDGSVAVTVTVYVSFVSCVQSHVHLGAQQSEFPRSMVNESASGPTQCIRQYLGLFVAPVSVGNDEVHC